MARLKDVPEIIRTIGLREFVRRIWRETLDDHLFLFAGSLAYAWLLALFPFLIFILHLVPFLPGTDRARMAEDASVIAHALMPDKVVDALWQSGSTHVQPMVETRNLKALLLSILAALWVASGGVTVTMAALDKCYDVDKIRGYFTRRPMAFGLTGVIALLAIIMIVLLPLGARFRTWMLEERSSISYVAIWGFDLLRGFLALSSAMMVVAVIYHFGPCVKRTFRPVTPGAVFAIVVWLALALIFKEYVNHFSGSRYERTYGAAGWVVILLLILYLDALVLLIGAEINSEIDFEILKVPRGSKNFRHAERAVAQIERTEPA